MRIVGGLQVEELGRAHGALHESTGASAQARCDHRDAAVAALRAGGHGDDLDALLLRGITGHPFQHNLIARSTNRLGKCGGPV